MAWAGVLFTLAVIALGIETFLCARYVGDSLGYDYRIIRVIPWLPAIPAIAYVCGTILAIAGLGLRAHHTVQSCVLVVGVYFLCGILFLALPRYLEHLANIR